MRVPLPVTLSVIERCQCSAVTSTPIIIVQHVRSDTVSFIELLRDQGYVIHSVTAIPYSIQADAVELLCKMGVRVLTPSLSQIDECLRSELLALASSDRIERLALVHEVGGYFADLLHREPELADHVVGAVEETKQGLWRYRSITDLRCPVVQIADSRLKQVESRYVGAAVALSTAELLRCLGSEIIGRPMGIVGYGDIGSACARFLRGMGNPVYVYDRDPCKMIAARSDGYTTCDPGRLTELCRVIIGCSGSPSVAADWFDGRSGDFYLASGSSRTVEFERLLLNSSCSEVKDLPASFTSYGDVRMQRLPLGQASITVMNLGAPVNFLSQSLPSAIIDLVFAQVAAALSVILAGGCRPGISELRSSTEDAIAHEWIRQYGY